MEGVGAGERLGRYLEYNPYAAEQRERGCTPEETGPIVHFAGKTGSLTGVRTHAAADLHAGRRRGTVPIRRTRWQRKEGLGRTLRTS
jgi:hypothetical protein